MAKKKITIEEELRTATKIKPRKNEDPAKFRARIVKAVNALDDAAWENLSEKSQGWYNDGCKALKAKDPIGEFPKGESMPEEAPEEKKTKKDDPTPAPEEGGLKKRGASRKYRELMITKPKWSKEELLAKVQEEYKFSAGTAEIVHYETKQTLEVLDKLGKLKD